MKKKWVAAIFAGLLVFGVCGCEKQPTETAEPTPAVTETETPTAEPAVERDALEVYQEALERLLVEHIDIDGYRFRDDEWDWIGEVEFAIADVDTDGEWELLIRYYRRTQVCGYDAEGGELLEKLVGTESCRFYDNGTAQEDHSHNQGWSGRFWPFTALRYDEREKKYRETASVEAWDGVFMKEAEIPGYPDDVDAEGAGFVYYIHGAETDYHDAVPVSQTEYDTWYDSIFGGAEEIKVNYQPLTQENIETVFPAE